MTENIYITGSVSALQNWSPDTALILSPANYPIWSSEFFVFHLYLKRKSVDHLDSNCECSRKHSAAV